MHHLRDAASRDAPPRSAQFGVFLRIQRTPQCLIFIDGLQEHELTACVGRSREVQLRALIITPLI
jgi:hypothetical protein